MIYVPADYKWTGIFGAYKDGLGYLGFIFTKTVYTYSHRHLKMVE